jgi:hypothetical protein
MAEQYVSCSEITSYSEGTASCCEEKIICYEGTVDRYART